MMLVRESIKHWLFWFVYFVRTKKVIFVLKLVISKRKTKEGTS